jgi:Ca2+-binding RTX toxin-like protein
LNAAAVSSNSVIDLNKATVSRIAGKELRIEGGIANAMGGDGDDLIRGDAGGNSLIGGRGNDTLEGGAGSD